MQRNRTWQLDATELRTQRNDILPILGGTGATIEVDFRTGKMPGGFSFSRNSTATYMRWNGSSLLVTSAAANEPRFDWASGQFLSVALSSPGLLIEPQKTNWLCHSQTFAKSGGTNNWVHTNMDTVSTNNLSPDGTNNATRFKALSTSATISCASGQPATVTGGRTFSVWLRRASGTGAVQITTNSAGTFVTQTITTSWRRYSVSTASGTTNAPAFRILIPNDEVEVWGAQLENAYISGGITTNSATSYIPTTTTAQTRLADLVEMWDSSTPTFEQVYNPNEGTFAFQFQRRSTPSNPVFSANDSSIDAQILFTSANTGGVFSITSAGFVAASTSAMTLNGGTSLISSSACTYRKDLVQGVATGTSPPSISSASLLGDIDLPEVSLVQLGADANGRFLHGVLYQLKYWPSVISGDQLIKTGMF